MFSPHCVDVTDLQMDGREVLSDVVRRRLAELGSPAPESEEDAAEVSAAAPVERPGLTPSEDPLPETLPRRAAPRRARGVNVQKAWAFAREHLVVVAIIVLAGTGWSVYSMTQARSVPVAPTVVHSPTPTPTPSMIQVHVVGAVKKPGVVKVVAGSRIHEVIVAAGGFAETATSDDLNLAAVATDGSQISVGDVNRPGNVSSAADGSKTGSAGPVNLNTATVEQLDTLPGVGPVTAQNIIDWRTAHGRFTRKEQVQEIDGIGPKLYARIAEKVTV